MLPALLWKILEKRFVFFPTSEVEFTPEDAGLAFEDTFFTTHDGLRLHGWYVAGTTGLTLLWFHGNGGNIGHRVAELVMLHRRLGANLLIFDYRGYGISQGTPSEQGTYRDARAALAYLRQRPDVAPEKLVYFGHSLGSAIALELAAAHPPLGLILVSPFASVSDMSRLVFPLLPAGWLVRNKYNSLARISKVGSPLLILHGELDDTVPISQGKKLYDAANPPKRFERLPEAGHNDAFEGGGVAYWSALEEFIGALEPGGSGDIDL